MTISTYRRSLSNTSAVSVAWTDRSHGDFHAKRVMPDVLGERRRAIVDLPWTTLDQVHGTEIVRVEEPGADCGRRADGAITSKLDAVLSVWAGDCAPVVLIGAASEIAIVHAGWRGLAAGILDRAIAAFSEPIVHGVLGPVIGPCCYEFGGEDASAVAAGVRSSAECIVRRDVDGRCWLDVPAAIAAVCRRHQIGLQIVGGCSGCSSKWFSHRARGEAERHAVAVWQHVV